MLCYSVKYSVFLLFSVPDERHCSFTIGISMTRAQRAHTHTPCHAGTRTYRDLSTKAALHSGHHPDTAKSTAKVLSTRRDHCPLRHVYSHGRIHSCPGLVARPSRLRRCLTTAIRHGRPIAHGPLRPTTATQHCPSTSQTSHTPSITTAMRVADRTTTDDGHDVRHPQDPSESSTQPRDAKNNAAAPPIVTDDPSPPVTLIDSVFESTCSNDCFTNLE